MDWWDYKRHINPHLSAATVLMPRECLALKKLMVWLEIIALGGQGCGCWWESDDTQVWIEFHDEYLRILGSHANRDASFEHRLTVERRQMVRVVYQAFRNFVLFSEYQPERCENLSEGWHAARRAGLTEGELVGQLLASDRHAAEGRLRQLTMRPMFSDNLDAHIATRRVRWWSDRFSTWRAAALVPPGDVDQIPDTAMPPDPRIRTYEGPPVFFGHYWFSGTPDVLAPNVACVDYSAAADGPLVAYRWEGEATLSARGFWMHSA